MIKLKDCKTIANAHNSMDQFELYINILNYTNNKQLNKLYNQCENYSTIKLQCKKYTDNIVIIHKSTKKDNTIQVSFFDKRGAYADKERLTLKDALKEVYKDYRISEVC